MNDAISRLRAALPKDAKVRVIKPVLPMAQFVQAINEHPGMIYLIKLGSEKVRKKGKR